MLLLAVEWQLVGRIPTAAKRWSGPKAAVLLPTKIGHSLTN